MEQIAKDRALFNQIKKHPNKITLKSQMKKGSSEIRESAQKQFRYIYADDPKYELGRGSFGQVFTCFYDFDPPLKLALKIIKVPHKYEDIKTIQHIVSTSRQQILALIKLRKNQNIIRIQDVVRDKQLIYMILEFCNDSDMVSFFGKLWDQNKITREIEIRYYFNQILNAFKSLHQHSFIHRDIKPSNILVKNGVLKVADFGLARQIFEQRQSIEQHVGTMITAAPQIVFRQQYSNKCDIYSLGVIFYWMLYQKFPFNEKVPTIQDFKENKLAFPSQNYIKVPQQTQQLVRQMLSYQEKQRISWKDLFQHPLFNGYNLDVFAAIDEEIKAQYDTSQIRQTYGRQYVQSLEDNDELLDIQIPRSYYKFLQQIEGQDQYNKYIMQEKKSLIESPGIGAHIQIKNQYKNQNVRIKFFRMVLIELETFEIGQKSQNKSQMILIRDLIIHGIQKYLIYLLNKIRDELIYISPFTIFKLKTLKEADKAVIHKNFVQQINEKVRGSEFFTGTKFTEAEVNKLKSKCQEYEIIQQTSLLFSQLHSGLISEFMNQLNGCIIQMIYFLKPWIFKMTRKNLIEKDLSKFKTVLLLIHHLFMFSMQSEVFPEQYEYDFDYDSFIENQQFKENQKFSQMKYNLLQILSRFE